MDLTTSYLGLACATRSLPAPRRSSQTVDGVASLAASGVGAVVLYSLFEEQVHREQLRDTESSRPTRTSFGEALSYFPAAPTSRAVASRTTTCAWSGGRRRRWTCR